MLARAFAHLTGKQLDDEADALDLLDQRELAALLVRNMAFPAHSLDRLWHVSAWNRAAMELFETDATRLAAHSQHLLMIVFDPDYRARFRPWEALARRLLADFKYKTRSLTYLPEYRTLWRSLRMLPDFPRIADSSDPGAGAAPGLVFQMRHSPARPADAAHNRHGLQRRVGLLHRHLCAGRPADAQHLRRERLAGPDQDLEA